MNQDILVDAVGKHLDMIETYVNAVALLAVAAAWAGVRRSREIEAFGTKFDRRDAFWALAVLYLIANTAILILFLRVGDLVLLIKPSHSVKAATTLATQSWVLNPFGYFGGSAVARFHSAEGYGLLIAVWWLCNASLSTLMDDKRNRAAGLLLGVFLAIGLGSMLAINRAYAVILGSLVTSAPALHAAVIETLPDRTVGTGMGILVGGLIFVATNRLQARFRGGSDVG